MKRVWIVLGLAVIAATALTELMPVVFAQHTAVTICHRTGSQSNPFVVITTDNQAIINAHVGPIPHPPKNGNADFVLPAGSTEADCAGDVPDDDDDDDGPDDV